MKGRKGSLEIWGFKKLGRLIVFKFQIVKDKIEKGLLRFSFVVKMRLGVMSSCQLVLVKLKEEVCW